MKQLFALLLALLTLAPLSALAAPTMPDEIPRSKSCEVMANGEAIPVMDTRVNLSRTWTSRPLTTTAPVTWLELDGPVELRVRFVGQRIDSAVVRPLSERIVPTVDGDTVTFALDHPAKLTVEINGSQEGALHLFADAPETDVPSGEGVTVYEAGLHEIGTVALQSGQTVYLAPGAVVRGQFVAAEAENIRICGLGVIDGGAFDRWEQQTVPIDLSRCQNVAIAGITILDPAAWTVNLYHCDNVTVDNIKIIGARSNSDGVTVQSCRRVAVRDCFVRGWDDNLVVKGYDGDCADISFEDCILWTDLAQSCEIGYETRADVIENIRFERITVLHANHKPVCSIHNSDHALVRHVIFRDITVEDCNLGQGDGAEYLIDLTTVKSQWSQTKERGNIRDVLLENINVLSGRVPAVRIFAAKKDYTIDGVTIRHLVLMGETVVGFDQLRYTTSPRKLGENIVIEP